MHNKKVHMVAFTLLVIGGLNWLFVAAFEFNLVDTIFGAGSGLSKAVYVLVGLSAIYELVGHKGRCSACSST